MSVENYFIYKGKTSKDFGLKIHNDLVFTAPERDVELLEVPGLDGDLVIDNGRLKGFNKRFSVSLIVPKGKTINQSAKEISEWLRNDVSWDKLTFTGYEGYYYEAICYETFDIQDILRTFGKAVITFRCKPYKLKNDGQSVLTITSGQTLINPEKCIAKPLIKVTGTGDITLKNNGVDWLILKSVDGFLLIDSKNMSVSKGVISYFEKMNANLKPLFPVLNQGNNAITWTGTVTKVEITPRWEAVV